MKKNIVWLASYPKSGNTWFRMFLANYLKNSVTAISLEEIERTPISSDAVGFEEISGFNPFELSPDEVDLYRPEMYQYLSENEETEAGILYKKTHDAYIHNVHNIPLFPKEVTKGAVYFVRNPLDVCVSYANHATAKIERTIQFLQNEKAEIAGKKSGQLRQIMFSWKNHIKSWQQQDQIPVHIVRYEDMKQDPINTFGSIIQFLGIVYDEERLKRSIINSDFTLLQQMEQEKGFKEKPQNSKGFFREGKTGNYREHLNEEQIKQLVTYHYDTMKEFGYLDAQGNLTI
ncbi:sulfotransferase domain-containing protein [Flavobacterium sp. GSA192]|uniref:sulfotransferase domain-containing protein n=1 Tax=Flavobacterium sp. GSA192 TaxID=2576304 RepID=UPI0011272609|nr:sulfotransferase domain-containing protein [Flavobacterium sp. GSA192]